MSPATLRPKLVLASRNPKKSAEMSALLAPYGFDVVSVAKFPDVPPVLEDGDTFAANAAQKASETAAFLNQWALGEDSGLCVDALGGAPGVYSARYSESDESCNRELTFSNIEQKILSATRKRFGEDADVTVEVNRETGHPTVTCNGCDVGNDVLGEILYGMGADAAGQVTMGMLDKHAPDAVDAANNAKLVSELSGVPDERRGAGYVCHIALADPLGRVQLHVEAGCRGRITHEPRGTNGFGYDPYFLIPEYHRTFGELAPIVKQQISHRVRAFRRLVPHLLALFPAP